MHTFAFDGVEYEYELTGTTFARVFTTDADGARVEVAKLDAHEGGGAYVSLGVRWADRKDAIMALSFHVFPTKG